MISETAPVAFAAILELLLTMSLMVGVYVVSSLGIMKLARKLGHPHPGYAFIPFYSVYMNGQLMDECSRRNGVPTRGYAKKLLFGTIAVFVSMFIMYSGFIPLILSDADLNWNNLASFFLPLVLGYILVMASAIVLAVFEGLGWWQLYRCFDEQRAVLWLMLSLFCSASIVLYLVMAARQPKPAPEEMQTQYVLYQ